MKIWTTDHKRRATPSELVRLSRLVGLNDYWFAVPMGGGKFAAIAPARLTHDLFVADISDDRALSGIWTYENAIVAMRALEEWEANGFEGEPNLGVRKNEAKWENLGNGKR